MGMARWRYIMLGAILLLSYFLATMDVRGQRAHLREQQAEHRVLR
jgi:hypothetical protein